MSKNPVTEALKAEFQRRGIPFKVEISGRAHLRWRFRHNGRDRVVVTAATPSDRRAPLNARAQLRRLLRGEPAARY